MKPLLLALALPFTLQAADFPALYNTEQSKDEPMPAEQAAREMKMPPGFHCSVFASEPDVQNPVGMAWDHKGRLWIAENYTYAERPKRFAMDLHDRVVILADKDHDGHAETRKVFTDKVQMLTSVEIGRGGVWLMCPPQVLFIPDQNEDDVPDAEPQVILDGFTVAEANYHNFANGLHWGPDGWLYGRCGHSCPANIGVPGTPDGERVPMKGGIWRFNPKTKVVEVLTTGTTNPWGHDWDENGECFFVNTVTGHLWHLIPGSHLKDSGPSLNPNVYDRLDMIADHYHFDTAGGWQKSKLGTADAFGGGHAHIGTMIYQGDQWPEYWRGKLLTLNMHGRRTNVERLEPKGSSFVGKHEPDVFNSTDPFFRGIDIRQGPDGSAYIIDYSDTGECHESTGVHRTSGRVFKISYGEPKAAKPMLQPACINGDSTLAKLWRQYKNGDAGTAMLHERLLDSNEHARTWAVRLLTDDWRLDDPSGRVRSTTWSGTKEALLQSFITLAKTDPSGLVQLTLASTLQRLPVNKRIDLAAALAPRAKDDASKTLDYMIWFGLGPVCEADPTSLLAVAKQTQSPALFEWMARSFASRMEKQPELLDSLIQVSMDKDVPTNALTGITKGLAGWRKAPKPKSWDTFAARINTIKSDASPALRSEVTHLSQIFGDGVSVQALSSIVSDKAADITARITALKTLIEARPTELRAICEAALDTRDLDTVAVRGLAMFDDAAVATKLLNHYKGFSASAKPAAIDALASRKTSAALLLKDVAGGKIPRTDLTAFHARQIKGFNDTALTDQLTAAWGDLRESAADKQKLIADLKAKLTPGELAKANLATGRILFQGVCSSCHTMYGMGGKIGPDLTGSGRANLDYLLENIADPSGVVSAEFRMNILSLNDGRAMSGIARAESDRTLTLRTLTEELTFEKSEIAKREISPMSMMPEGLLLALPPEQVRDLIAYLMHPTQVELPK